MLVPGDKRFGSACTKLNSKIGVQTSTHPPPPEKLLDHLLALQEAKIQYAGSFQPNKKKYQYMYKANFLGIHILYV